MTEFYEDFAPELTASPKSYSGIMGGRGRWSELYTDEGNPVGVLWTDDNDGLGLFPLGDADTDMADEVIRVIQANAAEGFPATDLFDYLVSEFDDDVYEGSLDDLFDTLSN